MIQKRVLIVNCFPGEFRVPLNLKFNGPNAMAPVFLAGLFAAEKCEIRLYDEVYSGWLEQESLFGWPDMLVLTGLNAAFDRFLHLTAYARTKNPNVIIVAGGSLVKMLKHYIRREEFFNYACEGDVEQLADVIQDAWGTDFISAEYREKGWVIPRYDLDYRVSLPGFVEASRSCYYRCSFCSITAERARYSSYDIDYVRAQIMALKQQSNVIFVDNNFYTRDPDQLEARFDLLEELYSCGIIKRWAALVTNDFFRDPRLLKRAKDSGCTALFGGIESFDNSVLKNYNKKYIISISQFDVIRNCLDAGIAFFYGLVLDPSTRTVPEMESELDLVLDTKNIPLPSFISVAIPTLGTPMFYDALKHEKFLPNVLLRDLDATTIVLKPVDNMNSVVKFVKGLQINERMLRTVAHNISFFSKHLHLPVDALMYMFVSSSMGESKFSKFIKSPHSFRWWGHERTYIGGTEKLDMFYSPSIRVESRYENYFVPTKLTNEQACLVDGLREDFPLVQ